MSLRALALLGTGLLWAVACNKADAPSAPSAAGSAGLAPDDQSNVVPVSVNGGTCGTTQSAGNQVNRACISLSLCAHGTNQCQIIDNILVDTGSVGLRLDRKVVTVQTTPVVTNGAPLAECNIILHNNIYAWGPIVTADVKLGGEPATAMPIQLLDPSYAAPQTVCTQTPSATVSVFQGQAGQGVNGYLGIGLQKHDCGASCAAAATGSVYQNCTGSTCQATTAPLPSQMTNPVALLPIDNNGFVLNLPAVPATGVPSENGQLILGIGTRANNIPAASVTALQGNGQAMINATVPYLNDTNVMAYVDTGVPYYWFVNPQGITVCPDSLLCPTTPLSLSATLTASSGSSSASTTLSIGNGDSLYNSTNSVFANYGASTNATIGGASLVLGLPFLFGKTMYFALPGVTTSLGAGPYVGF